MGSALWKGVIGSLRSTRTPVSVALVCGAIGLGLSCAHATGRVALPGSDLGIAWPLPPSPPRIVLLGALAAPADVGVRPSLFRRALDLFMGDREERIQQPYGVAVDGRGRIFVADAARAAVHVFDPESRRYGIVEDVGGRPLRAPIGLAVVGDSIIWVADAEAAAVIAMTDDGDEVTRIESGLVRPAGVAWDATRGALYVVDVHAHDIKVFDAAGSLRFVIGGRGTEPGRFNFPTNVAVDGEGRIYITDSMNFRVQMFSAQGEYEGQFGRTGDAAGDLPRPKGIGVDSEGHIYVVEGLYDVINVFDRGGRHLLTFGSPGARPGEFWLATGLTIDAQNRIYVADSFNGRVQVFQYLTEGF